MNKLLILFFFLSASVASAQTTQKEFNAERAVDKIKIDGVLDEKTWGNTQILSGFTQRRPNPGKAATKDTEVMLSYDDETIYVAARIYEKKDSIFNFLTNRDNVGNADFFGIAIDPFKAGLNGVGLFVTSAGVQLDYLYSNGGDERFYRNDESWNAVWLSETKI